MFVYLFSFFNNLIRLYAQKLIEPTTPRKNKLEVLECFGNFLGGFGQFLESFGEILGKFSGGFSGGFFGRFWKHFLRGFWKEAVVKTK